MKVAQAIRGMKSCIIAPLAVLWLLWPLPAWALDVQEVVSPGGIMAWLVEDHSVPLISLSMGFHGGASVDPEGKGGLARFTSALLDEGAGDLDSRAFQQRLNDLAIELRFDAGIDEFTGTMRTLTDRRDSAFELLRLALTAPRFDDEPVERIRGQLLASLADAATDPGSIADRILWRAAFPSHPYGRAGSGRKDSIVAINRDDLRQFVTRRLARDNLVIGVVGDITAAELKPLLDGTFGALPLHSAEMTVAETSLADAGVTIVADRDVPQSVILFSQPGIKRDDPDFFAVYVVNHILGGGGFSSRLTNEIREKRGLAYSVGTDVVTLDHAGVIMGSVATKNESAADTLSILKSEWAHMRDEGPTEKELEEAKLYLTGSYPLRFTSTKTIADSLVGIQLEGFGKDYFEKRNGYVNAVTIEEARRVAKRLLDPDRLSIVVVGRPAGVSPTAAAPDDLF
ncbi:MAG: M16 family metallopeptidase [Dongiaceae bacterium]